MSSLELLAELACNRAPLPASESTQSVQSTQLTPPRPRTPSSLGSFSFGTPSLTPTRPRTPSLSPVSTPSTVRLTPEIPDREVSDNNLLTPERIRRYKSNSCDRDTRIRIQLLHSIGWKYADIAQHLKVTIRQVQYAVTHRLTPQHRMKKGPAPVIRTPHRQELKAWLNESPSRRDIPWPEIPLILEWNYGERAVAPTLTLTNRLKRFRFSDDHSDWQYEEWSLVLWTDETWARGGSHGRRFVTIMDGEELDFITPSEKKKGWLFWASFAGRRKGPCLFWEDEWGTVTAESYQEHIVPLIHEFMRQNPGLILMQDNAPSHRARSTIAELTRRGCCLMWWPPCSPDLNPIEHVWQWMKDWIARFYPERMTKAQLRQAVYAAWDAVPEDFLESLVHSMPKRVNDVFMHGGGNSRY